MLINVRGTNGSGKSHLVREVMRSLPPAKAHYVTGRKKPAGYVCGSVFVPGHYEIANGGLDTMHPIGWAFGVVREFMRGGCHVLCEGMNFSGDVKHILNVAERRELLIVHLTTSVEECVRSVRRRGHHISEKTIVRLHEKMRKDAKHLESLGIRVLRLDRESALDAVRGTLEALR